MLNLDRIMSIAREHARHCCGQGETNGEHHNIQVLSVAIQEALSENDDVYGATKTKALRTRNPGAALPTDGKSGQTSGGRKARSATE